MTSDKDPQVLAVNVTVVATDHEIVPALFGDQAPERGTSRELGEGVSVHVADFRSQRGWGQPEVLELVITFASNVSTGLVVAWLTERLKGRKARLEIEGQPVAATDREATEQALQDAVERAGA